MNFLIFPKSRIRALVVKVAASDLIVLEDGRHVKLIGVESAGKPPVKFVKYDEKGHVIEEPEEPTIPLQEQALTYAQDLLENKKVRLEYDVDAVRQQWLSVTRMFIYLTGAWPTRSFCAWVL